MFTAEAMLNPCDTYTLKLVVADSRIPDTLPVMETVSSYGRSIEPTNLFINNLRSVGSSEVCEEGTDGIGNSHKNKDYLRVYPNPAQHSLIVQYKRSFTGSAVVEVYNLLGQQVMNLLVDKSLTNLDISHLSNGVYRLVFKHGQEQYVEQLTIVR